MVALFERAAPKAAKEIGWSRGKKAVVRFYSGGPIGGVGVLGDTWIDNNGDPIQTFASHEEAVQAFERMEIGRLRAGQRIERFELCP